MTTPVEEIRRAAQLMRERAHQASPGPWESLPAQAETGRVGHQRDIETVNKGEGHEEIAFNVWRKDASHIASWHPGVALAVADLLNALADEAEYGRAWPAPVSISLQNVVRAYPGGAS